MGLWSRVAVAENGVVPVTDTTVGRGHDDVQADGLAPEQSPATPAEAATTGERAASAAAAAPPSAGAQSPEIQRAAALYREAEARYGAGDLQGALELLTQAHELSQRPALLFNMGQVNRELGRCREAVKRYRQYLSSAPDGARRDDASRAVDQLEPTCPDGVVVRAPPPQRAHNADAPASSLPNILAWSAIGVGAALGGGAVYSGLKAKQTEDDVERLEAEAADTHRSWEAVGGPAREAEGRRQNALAIEFGVGAACLVAAGVSLLVFSPAGQPHGATRVSLGVQDGGPRVWYALSL